LQTLTVNTDDMRLRHNYTWWLLAGAAPCWADLADHTVGVYNFKARSRPGRFPL